MNAVVTVIFTGLMVFDGPGQVDLVLADQHKILVTTDREHPVSKSLAFEGLTNGPVGETSGFGLPALNRIFSPKSGSGGISLEPKEVMAVTLKGGTIGPFGSYASCDVQLKSTLFWQGVRWQVSVPDGAQIVIDKGLASEYKVPLTDKLVVIISNNYDGPGSQSQEHSHVLMYEQALKQRGKVDFHKPECGPIYPPLGLDPAAKDPIGIKKNSPVTCPPTTLR